MRILTFFIYLFLTFTLLKSKEIEPVAEWYNFPEYKLGQNASANLGPWQEVICGNKTHFVNLSISPLTNGLEPTERIYDFYQKSPINANEFTIEFWIMNHVDNKIGFGFFIANRDNLDDFMLFSYLTDKLKITTNYAKKENNIEIAINPKESWKEIFSHICLVNSGNSIKIVINGKIIREFNSEANGIINFMELFGYFHNEPFMKIENLIKSFRIYDKALAISNIIKNFENYKELANKGVLFPKLFHYNAGPYLNNATKSSIGLIWETSKPSKTTIYYGKELPLTKKIQLSEMKLINEVTIANLEAETQYFYKLESIDESGDTISTDILTFSTAVKDNNPVVRFAVIGDTESRPHINNQICQRIWNERPHFAIQLGDLTDGGKELNKFEWNYEYFNGMRALISRVPIFPVPGNGEGDLYWYKRYHQLPEPKEFYSFKYGNCEFFMLNSVPKNELQPGGKQFLWLENQLANSNAKWKFVALHYAPYTSDEDDYGNTWTGSSDFGDLKIRPIVKIFEKYAVDIVFFGHLHSYERTYPIYENKIDNKKGVIYLQNGGAGGNLEDFAPVPTWFSAKVFRGFHYTMIYINDNQLELRTIDLNGALIDLLTIMKEK